MTSLEEIREETRVDVEYFVKIYSPDIYKEEYPIVPKGISNKDYKKEIDMWYIDQSPQYGVVSSTFTPWGIKRMESWYIDQIQKGYPSYTKEQMELLIKCNPHLHNIIKTNLLNNLENAKK